jgi:fatty-acyl-CoA synthase
MSDLAAQAPLTPISFLRRSAVVWRDRVATSFAGRTTTYGDLLERCERVAGGLRASGVGPGDRVAALLPNVPAQLELHFAVPGSGAVLVPLNTRLSAPEYAYILEHAGVHTLVTAPAFEATARAAVAILAEPPRVVLVGEGSEYEALAAEGTRLPLGTADELALFSINYTSGTTGKPKGVMYTHRGCYLHALGVIVESRLTASSAYLWTLPMFHCHGWAYPWAVTAVGARHECLDGLDPAEVWRALDERGVTHMCAAPTVITMLLESPEARPLDPGVSVFVGGAPPAPALLERASRLGMAVTHLYGLTESYGPIAVCAWKPEWDALDAMAQTGLRARQGVPTVVSAPFRVVDAAMRDVAADGTALGEIVLRGNNVTIGYFRDPEATATAFAGGWFHTGDLGVMHEDGYIELRDRLKDIVVSGGENISTVEVEAALVAHEAVVEAAVIGVPDDHWGEVVKAFVVRRAGSQLTADELCDFVRTRLARFKVPKEIELVEELPKTATGKIQKFVLRGRQGSASAAASAISGTAASKTAAESSPAASSPRT